MMIGGMAAAFVMSIAPVSAQTVKVATVDAEAMPDFRDRLQSALLEGGVQLSTSAGGRDRPAPDMIVSARVQPQGATASVTSARDYCIGGTTLGATADLRVRDARSGAVLWGGMITKTVSIGSDVVAGGGAGTCGSMTPWIGEYRRLTNALALAVARRIVFRVRPLRVVSVAGRTVVLNQGGALLPLGTMVQIAGAPGVTSRVRVTATASDRATASFVDAPRPIAPNAGAEIIEEDSAAANARRYEKVDLP